MSIAKLISWITSPRRATHAETIGYDTLFKGSANAPAVGSAFLPGLRPIENEVDSYFKEVFAGPVF